MIGPVLFASSEKPTTRLNGFSVQPRNFNLKKSKGQMAPHVHTQNEHCAQIRQQYNRMQHLSSELEGKLRRKEINLAEYKSLMLMLCEKLTETIRSET